MKLVSWFMPIVPRNPAISLPITNAGNPVSRRNPSNRPGSTHVSWRSHVTHFSSRSLHLPTSQFFRFVGSVFRRIADHRKYLFGRCWWISLFTLNSRQLTRLNRRRPTRGRTTLQNRRISNETPIALLMFRRRLRNCRNWQ